jgi:hypothetical protein
MILVIPFTGSSDYLDDLSARLLKLGGLGGHRLIVPAPSNLLAGAEVFVSGVRSQFVAAEVLPVRTPGTPIVRLFRDGVMAAARVKHTMQEISNAPVLWLEPGYLPTRPDWADMVQSAFFNTGGGVKILGEWRKRADTVVGNAQSRYTVPGGWEPVGPTVFPALFINSCEMLHRINDASAPWRERLQFILDAVRAESPAISNSPESCLLRMEPEQVRRTQPAPPDEEPTLPEVADPAVAEEPATKPVRRAAVRNLASVETTL